MDKSLEKYEKDFWLLLEAGFVAVNNIDEDSALKLFTACTVLKPDSTFPKVGFAYMHLCKLELKKASTLLEEVLAINPENEMAETLLGIVLSMMPKKSAHGEKLLEKATKSSQSDIKKLANEALHFVEHTVKQKVPSPMDVQTPKK